MYKKISLTYVFLSWIFILYSVVWIDCLSVPLPVVYVQVLCIYWPFVSGVLLFLLPSLETFHDSMISPTCDSNFWVLSRIFTFSSIAILTLFTVLQSGIVQVVLLQ